MLSNNEFKFLRKLTDDELSEFINTTKDEVLLYAAEEEMVRRATIGDMYYEINEDDTYELDELTEIYND